MSSEPACDGLVERFVRGDRDALAELFCRERERLARMIAFRLDARLYGRVDPDNILQEAFVAASERIEHFAADPAQSVFVWLRLIVLQTMVDVYRRHLGTQGRDPRRESPIPDSPWSDATSAAIARQLAGNLTSPSQAAIRDETAESLRQALDALDPADREVLALRHFEEVSNSEAAEILGITQKAASMRYARALRRLKDVLSEVPWINP